MADKGYALIRQNTHRLKVLEATVNTADAYLNCTMTTQSIPDRSCQMAICNAHDVLCLVMVLAV
jgi:hypothetical protein